jgi:hypothetical protein
MHATFASWMVPVPVAPTRTRSFRAEHRPLSVRVALGRIRAFDLGGASDDDIGAADLQLNADGNVGARLGSGRALFYRGHYLKGVGRTLLAGNWNNRRDAYHSSGHMLPSAAVREYLVSRVVEAAGWGQLIVPCVGLQLTPLSAAARISASRRCIRRLRTADMRPPSRCGRGSDRRPTSPGTPARSP